MRYCVAVLILLPVLPLMNVLAAPAPEPFTILDIGPPRKGETAEQYRDTEIHCLTFPYGLLGITWDDPVVRKLPSVAPMRDARPWLAKNLCVTAADGGRRLRLTFRGGNRAEQVIILNTLLRVSLRLEAESLKGVEESLQRVEEAVPRLQKLVLTEPNPVQLDRYKQDLASAPTHIAEHRAEIARRKQFAVIKWAN